jgi:hypothetical protein
MYDLFVAEMRCPNCGVVIPVTAHTNMQTGIRDEADGSALGIGYEFDPVDLKPENVVRAGYALVSTPSDGRPIRLLDVWICPSCNTEQWAMTTIDKNTIQLIEAVPFTRATLDAANYISDVNADVRAKAFSDQGASSVETLRRNLP